MIVYRQPSANQLEKLRTEASGKRPSRGWSMIRNAPKSHVDYFALIAAYRPEGSDTVVSLVDASTGARLPMFAWGRQIYAPVYKGMHFALEVSNRSDLMMAYPTFVEAANLWSGGPAQPEECQTTHMWELQPHQSMKFDAMMNPNAQRGRPMIITETGFGSTVGEATFGTDQFRGQVRVYERLPTAMAMQAYHAQSAAHSGRRGGGSMFGGGFRGSSPLESSGSRGGDDEIFMGLRGGDSDSRSLDDSPDLSEAVRGSHGLDDGPPATFGARGVSTASRGAERRGFSGARRGGSAGIGLGEEEHRQHVSTGMFYEQQAKSVLAIYAEFRDDLAEMVFEKTGKRLDFNRWNGLSPNSWWTDAFMWSMLTNPTAPQVPVTPGRPVPHRPHD